MENLRVPVNPLTFSATTNVFVVAEKPTGYGPDKREYILQRDHKHQVPK